MAKVIFNEKTMVYKMDTRTWSVERIMFLIGGVFELGSVILGLTVHMYWLYFTGFVGFMLIFFALTGYCPMAIIVDKVKGRK